MGRKWKRLFGTSVRAPMVHLSANTVNDLIFLCFRYRKTPLLSIAPPLWIRVAAVCPSVVVAAGPFPPSDDSCILAGCTVTWPTPLLDWNSPWAMWRTTFCATTKRTAQQCGSSIMLTCCANKHRHHLGGVIYFHLKSKSKRMRHTRDWMITGPYPLRISNYIEKKKDYIKMIYCILQ